MIKDNIERIKNDISLICQGLGKNPSEISLVVVTKAATPEMILEALQNGITDIAENKVQDAEKKLRKLGQLISDSGQDYAVKYHMVGHLQSNKVKSAVNIFNLIQSVDSLRVAAEIEKQAEGLNKTIDILAEVNTSNEPSKFGVSPQETMKLIEDISKLKRIRVMGLMTVAQETDNIEEVRPCFKQLRLLKEKIYQEFDSSNVQIKYLSMGMTNDYKIALEEGSNMLRIGRAIFSNE